MTPSVRFIAFVALTLAFLVVGQKLDAAETIRAIDMVVEFTPGSGQMSGQDDEYFPTNIFGMPDPGAGEHVPAITPTAVLSLGMDGEIIVGFENGILLNKPGPDFIVFENAFYIGGSEKTYAEPAIVAVSSDGVEFVEFPYDAVTLEGCAGVSPTIGAGDHSRPLSLGGDAFDLDVIGVDSIRYIRITDITSLVVSNPEHPFWDPTLSGFDLDAVVGLHVCASGSGTDNELLLHQSNSEISLTVQGPLNLGKAECTVYSLNGMRLVGWNFDPRQAFALPTGSLARGAYLLAVRLEGRALFTEFFHP